MLMTTRRNRLSDSAVTNELAVRFNRTAMQTNGKPRTFESLASVTSLADDEESMDEDDSDDDDSEEKQQYSERDDEEALTAAMSDA